MGILDDKDWDKDPATSLQEKMVRNRWAGHPEERIQSELAKVRSGGQGGSLRSRAMTAKRRIGDIAHKPPPGFGGDT